MGKYRHELKMSINPFDREVLVSRLSHVLKKDSHSGDGGHYDVRSLYFDDQDDKALLEKLAGVTYREKFRIRTYGDAASIIRLEKKVKNNNLGYKESAPLTINECQALINGKYEFLHDRPEMVCRQLYIKLRTGLFKPKTIVEYRREAYVWEPGRVRITIDSNLRTGLDSIDFLNHELPMTGVVDSNTSILEIKYDSYLPSHVSNLIQLDNRQKSAISKYVLARRFG